MKKTIIALISIMLIISLIGCQERKKSVGDQLVEDLSDNIVEEAVETAEIENTEPVTVEKPTAEEKQAAAETAPKPATKETKEVTVTEEELDDLLKSIESIETEDLGGLSN